jgi:hypothetical protein
MATRTRSEQAPGGADAKPQQAQQKATEVAAGATQASKQVAQQAAGQGKQVAAETARQARDLVGQASAQVQQQAGAQQKRAAEGLRALGTQLQSMASKSEQDGVAKEVVRRASDAAEQAAGWLERREPGELVNEMRDYARQHPGTFLAGAAVAGLVVGRLTRGLTATDGGRGDGQQRSEGDQASGKTSAPPSEPEHAAGEGSARVNARAAEGEVTR